MDAATGSAVVVSGGAVGSGPEWIEPRDVESGPAGLFVADAGAIYHVDPETGARSVLPDSVLASTEAYQSLSLGPDDRLLASTNGRLWECDSTTGVGGPLSGASSFYYEVALAADGVAYGVASDGAAGRIGSDGQLETTITRGAVSIALVPEAGAASLGCVALLGLAFRARTARGAERRPRTPRRGGRSTR